MQRMADRNWVAGAVLIIVGLVFLAGRLAPGIEPFIPLGIGLLLLAVFLVSRSSAALVPGGIVSGVGAGILLSEAYPEPLGGALFLISLGVGFALVAFLAVLMAIPERHTWALIPGGILIAIGALTSVGERGREIFDLIGTWWPVALVALGIWILIGSMRRPRPAATGPMAAPLAPDEPAADRAGEPPATPVGG
jgi:hypothetical protein